MLKQFFPFLFCLILFLAAGHFIYPQTSYDHFTGNLLVSVYDNGWIGNNPDATANGIIFEGEDSLFGVTLYTTYFTSVWLWAYAASIMLIRLSMFIRPVWKFLRWALPIDAKPLRSIGIVAFVPPLIVSTIVAMLF